MVCRPTRRWWSATGQQRCGRNSTPLSVQALNKTTSLLLILSHHSLRDKPIAPMLVTKIKIWIMKDQYIQNCGQPMLVLKWRVFGTNSTNWEQKWLWLKPAGKPTLLSSRCPSCYVQSGLGCWSLLLAHFNYIVSSVLMQWMSFVSITEIIEEFNEALMLLILTLLSSKALKAGKVIEDYSMFNGH